MADKRKKVAGQFSVKKQLTKEQKLERGKKQLKEELYVLNVIEQDISLNKSTLKHLKSL